MASNHTALLFLSAVVKRYGLEMCGYDRWLVWLNGDGDGEAESGAITTRQLVGPVQVDELMVFELNV